MAKMSLRKASIYCLLIWAVIWLMFLMIRFSSFDIRVLPGIGPIMLIALIVALLAPVAATVLAGAALVRQPRAALNWLIFVGAIVVLLGQTHLFMISRWM
jgi:hypothetical protein